MYYSVKEHILNCFSWSWKSPFIPILSPPQFMCLSGGCSAVEGENSPAYLYEGLSLLFADWLPESALETFRHHTRWRHWLYNSKLLSLKTCSGHCCYIFIFNLLSYFLTIKKWFLLMNIEKNVTNDNRTVTFSFKRNYVFDCQ